jgi:nucleoside-diphosphate-sugar epimerase
LAELPVDVGRLIYVSSIGVYGHTAGEWVDEDSECNPQRAGGKAVLAAEQLLASHPLGARSVVLRLAGIYGPERVPRLEDVRQETPLTAVGESFLNLIHVDDAVAAILAAETSTGLPTRYVIGDGCPVRRAEFYGELARQLGVSAPQFVEPDRDASSARRDLSSKRIRNRRMLAELVPRLLYPSYREGLANVVCFASEEEG